MVGNLVGGSMSAGILKLVGPVIGKLAKTAVDVTAAAHGTPAVLLGSGVGGNGTFAPYTAGDLGSAIRNGAVALGNLIGIGDVAYLERAPVNVSFCPCDLTTLSGATIPVLPSPEPNYLPSPSVTNVPF